MLTSAEPPFVLALSQPTQPFFPFRHEDQIAVKLTGNGLLKDGVYLARELRNQVGYMHMAAFSMSTMLYESTL